MNSWKCTIPAMCLLATQIAAAQLGSPFAGEWVNYSNNGMYASPDGKCVGRSMEERRYIINPAGDALVATYASIWHMRWLHQESPDCAYPTLPPKPYYIGNRVWFVDMARVNGQTYDVRANYKECIGDVCTLANVTKSSFTTTLLAKDGQLHDIVKDQKDQKDQTPLVFEPIAKAQREATSTAIAFIEKWRAMPGDDTALAHIRALLGPTFNDDERSRRVLRQYYVARLEKSAGYKLIEAYTLAPNPNGWPQNTPVVFFAMRNDQINGQAIGETYELVYLNGSWKLLGFQF
ncbi:MAG: hypothetical protein EOP38_07580 [Rubrivivax sp.]|nr:MAG: hypothetical protein EOP38_07580 [Rubrivivax sp.]